MSSYPEEFDYRFSEKWNSDIESLGFTMVPNALLIHFTDLKLMPSEFLLLINIESYRWKSDRLPYPSVETLAKRTGMTTRTITRLVTSLEKDRKVLKRIKRKNNSNQYSVRPLVERLSELMIKDKNRVNVRHFTTQSPDTRVWNNPTYISSKEYLIDKDTFKEDVS